MSKRTRRAAVVICGSVGFLLAPACIELDVPDFADWPVDTAGYEIEELPVEISASYARGEDVYLGLPTGAIKKARDSDLADPWIDLSRPIDAGPRLLFASRGGVVFASANERPVYRTSDGGATWQICLDVPVWRMDEDDEGDLYAGNYTHDNEHLATVYRSSDAGMTWRVVYQDVRNRHIHTVRWDSLGRRLYIAFGDSGDRGRAYSDDRGASFVDIVRDYRDGPTDAACTANYIFWCTDNTSGQVWRVHRETGASETLIGRSQYIWFGVGRGSQIYVGTVASAERGRQRAALLASADEGETWQKLLETDESTGPYSHGFGAESRELSAGGWLYCTGGSAGAATSYRIRHAAGSADSRSATDGDRHRRERSAR